jgi:hypothetical protein
MKAIPVIATLFYFLLTNSCSNTKKTTTSKQVFSKEASKDLTGECSTKNFGYYTFANTSIKKIEITIWNNPGKYGSGDYPQLITVNSGESKTLYDLKPVVYAYEIRYNSGQSFATEDGQFKVETCKDKTYTFK